MFFPSTLDPRPASILKFPSLAERTGAVAPGTSVTLRMYYESVLLPDLRDEQFGLASRSLKEDRIAINHWERCTGNPDLLSVEPEHIELLRDRMLQAGAAAPTINKTWRELKSMFSAAVEDGFCHQVPLPRQRRQGRRMRSRLVKEHPKRQREIITEEELTRLWRACRHATYPRGRQFPAPLLWRVALVLFWTYGARTTDFLQRLKWEDVRFGDRLLLFTARKTTKLQGLPLTPIVEKHLRSIKGHAERVFPGFNSPGCYLRARRKWKRGYNATWRGEIQAAAGLLQQVTIKNFRERVVTRYNAIHAGLGSWIAGHYMPGVTAQNYDLPTDQIRDLICSAPVPACFAEIG